MFHLLKVAQNFLVDVLLKVPQTLLSDICEIHYKTEIYLKISILRNNVLSQNGLHSNNTMDEI